MPLRSLFTGVSGLKVHQTRLDVISNNIANVNTTGFKASRARFSDILSQTIEIATSPESGRGGQNPKQIGLGVQGTTITRDMQQGSIEITNRTADLAIQGGGFFILRDGETIGEWYTRDGHFNVDSSGDLTLASNGFRVQGWNGFFDPLSGEFTMDSSNPVEDIEINLTQQMGPQATSTIEFGANLDSRLSTAIDPIRVNWTKNGTSREVEVRFTKAHATEQLYLWQMYNPALIDSTTGDFTRITTDTNGTAVQGIIELNPDTGRVMRNYINTADDNTADSAADFITDSTNELPTTADIWASVNTVNTFNGYDFITLTTQNDGDNVAAQSNERASTVSTNTTTNTITADWTDDPFSQVASTNYPTGFVLGAVLDITTPIGTAGSGTLPGNSLGAPVQYIDQVTNEVATKRLDVNIGGGVIRTTVQLAGNNIISTNRNNPQANGILGTTTGTDADSLRIFIDGTEYTRVSATSAFTSGSAQFALDADSGIVEINGQISSGTNIIASYGTELRANSTYTVTTNTTFQNAFLTGAVPVSTANIGNGTIGTNATVTRTLNAASDAGDGSIFYKSGSATTMTLVDVSAGVTQTFTEVPYLMPNGVAITTANIGANRFTINPTTGAIVMGTFSGGAAVDNADTISSFTFGAHRGTRDNNQGGAAITGVSAADNRFGRSDLWRVRRMPAGGSETSTVELYLQGDYTGTVGTEAPDAETLSFLPTFSSSTPARRVELNYEADDRVNVIIPNGLTKSPNVNPLVDLTEETFAVTPNTTQITGNAGNNNQADSGDTVSVTVNEPEEYRYSTAIQVFDSIGTSHNVPLRFERLSTNRWITYAIDPTDPDGERIAFLRLITFDADGNFDLTSTLPYEAPLANGTTNDGFLGIYFDPAQVGGAAPPAEGASPMTITPDFTDLVQTARKSDAVVASQNGFPPGRLESYSFNDEGFAVGLFDNGRSLNLARVALQVFVNPEGVVSVGGNMFKDTVNAGKLGSPQRPGFDGAGTLVPGGLEQSNVDLSVEFVDLIITQRGFQAQSRTITTADQVLQEILGLKR